MRKPMRLLVAGSRTFDDFALMVKVLDRLTLKYRDVTIINGGAKGADQLSDEYARRWWLTTMNYFPDYQKHGKRAPLVRNQEMVEAATHAVFFWDGKSPGTKDCIWRAKNWNLKVKVIEYTKPKVTKAGKVEHVLTEMKKAHGGHHCHWPGCRKDVPPATWGCKEHWFKLPKRLRDKVWAAYVPGQEQTKTPSREYLKVAKEVQTWIEENYR